MPKGDIQGYVNSVKKLMNHSQRDLLAEELSIKPKKNLIKIEWYWNT